MAITDIQISEELMTNAPSIKYRGQEGPKSPQEMEMMADAMLQEEYEKYVYDLLEQRPEATPMSFEEFRRMVIGEGQMSGGQPLPEDPTKPVNPFQPKPIGPLPDKRQMAAYGGIMGMDGRRQYGIGSFLKKKIRNIIPNEVSKVAQVAAPFIAPFNPLAAAVAGGLGSFDQTGSISQGLKSGLMNYALGQGARYLGGADFQGLQNPFTRDAFSMPTGSGGIKELFKGKSEFVPSGDINVRLDQQPSNISLATGDGSAMEAFYQGVAPKPSDVVSKTQTGNILKTIKDFALDNKLLTGLAAGTLGAAALMGNMEPDEIQDLQRGEGLDIEGIRAEVQEAMLDETGEKLAALRVKYPFLGRRDTKDIDAMGKAMGGRIGFSSGRSADYYSDMYMKYAQDMIKDGNAPMDIEDFIKMIKEQERTSNAQGGRIGFDNGGGIMMASAPDPMDERNSMMENLAMQYYGRPLKLLNDKEIIEIEEMMDELDPYGSKPKPRKNRTMAQEGGIMDLGGMEKDYRNTGGFVDLGAKEKADDVPARLSVNEFVFTADAVRNAGGGDIDKGAEVMENMMKHLEQGGQVSDESQGMAGAQQMFETSERLSEVI